MNILQIAVHLGGGVGKAIAGMALQGRQDTRDCHRILLLQAPEKEGWVRQCRENGISVTVWDGTAEPFGWADVLVVNWWNHPVMAGFLANFPDSPAARVLWCHANGVHYPVLPYGLAAAFDRVLFTSPYSIENPFWTKIQREDIRNRADVVYGMGQFQPAAMAPKTYDRADASFVMGYVGTLNFGKIHPEFAAYCKAARERVPNLRFVLIGDRDAQLERSMAAAGLAGDVTYTGFVDDVPGHMRTFDAFGYLLNPTHYGTTENVLLEAMACGLPVLALRQNVEQFIVPPDGGVLVETPGEYAEAVAYLAGHPQERARMGRCARQHVIQTYDAARNAAEFRRACEAAGRAPRNRRARLELGPSPWHWFLSCLSPQDKTCFLSAQQKLQACDRGQWQQAVHMLRTCPAIFREQRKSSLLHFADTYPKDAILQSVATEMRQE